MDQQYILLEKKIQDKQLADRKKAFDENIAMCNVAKHFIQKKGLLVYGGLALNNSLPKNLRFYDEYELPDYDFFSSRAREDAKELANIYANLGYEDIEVKPGLHINTYKVYVNFMAIADITYVPENLYKRMQSQSKAERSMILKHNPDLDINIAPMSFLRMSLHLELSRPDGFIERWTKIYKRMVLFYKTYPLQYDNCDIINNLYLEDHDEIYRTLLDKLKEFLSNNIYPALGWEVVKIYLKESGYNIPENTALDFNMSAIDIISEDYANTAKDILIYLRKLVEDKNVIKLEKHSSLYNNEIIPSHFIIKYKKRPIIIIYQSQACYAYKEYKGLRIASIDTMLSLMYGYLLSERSYYNSDKIKCIINILLNIEKEQLSKRVIKKKLFSPFEIKCYGYQQQLEDLRKQRMEIKNLMKVYRPSKKSNKKENK